MRSYNEGCYYETTWAHAGRNRVVVITMLCQLACAAHPLRIVGAVAALGGVARAPWAGDFRTLQPSLVPGKFDRSQVLRQACL